MAPVSNTDTLQAIAQQLTQLSNSSPDLLKKTALCQQALDLLPPAEKNEKWASYQYALGQTYYNRALAQQNQEETAGLATLENELDSSSSTDLYASAIAHFTQSLTIFNAEQHLEMWADINFYLGQCYQPRKPEGDHENIAQAIDCFTNALTYYTLNNYPDYWADAHFFRGQCYEEKLHRHTVSQATGIAVEDTGIEDIEHIIANFTNVTTRYTHSHYPDYWADANDSLGKAYLKRQAGSRKENVDSAILALTNALSFYQQPENNPTIRANIQYHLANAYAERITGNRDDNLENAIALYGLALNVYTREQDAHRWAMSLNALGSAYKKYRRGDVSANLEQAKTLYEQALQVHTQQHYPQYWATLQNNLGTVYIGREVGDRTQNIEAAIAALKNSLSVWTADSAPQDWAMAQDNLGVAYANLERMQGDYANNLELAIVAHQQALTVYTRAAFPRQWATAQHNLGNAYAHRVHGDEQQNIHQAITAYQLALTERTREANAWQWANTQNSLAAAYVEQVPRASNSNASNSNASNHRDNNNQNAQAIENAIALYQDVLTVRTRQDTPLLWANTQHNLGTAYSSRLLGDPADNIQQAISAYSNALQVSPPFSADYRNTARLLGNLYAEKGEWEKASSTYQLAIQAAKTLYRSAIFKSTQSATSSAHADLYRCAAFAYSQQNKLKEAIACLEQGKTQSLRATLQRDQADLTAIEQQAPELYQRYQKAAQNIRILEQQSPTVAIPESVRSPELSLTSLSSLVSRAQSELTDAIAAIRTFPGYQTFLTVPSLTETFATIEATLKSALQSKQAVVYVFTTEHGGCVLIATQSTSNSASNSTLNSAVTSASNIALHAFPLSNFSEAMLTTLISPDHPDGWFSAYAGIHYTPSDAHAEKWKQTISHMAQTLGKRVMTPVVDALNSPALKDFAITDVVMIPCGFLSFLPLHAAQLPATATPQKPRRYAIDDLHITYAPSLTALHFSQQATAKAQVTTQPFKKTELQNEAKSEEANPEGSLLAIANPTPPPVTENQPQGTPQNNTLPNSESEIAMAVAQFPTAQTFIGAAATRANVLAALPQHNILHFSCHGALSDANPLDSGLYLTHPDRLLLSDFFSLQLQGVRLVVLSACETALSGTAIPDESLSLPTGLIQAGVGGIIASLWPVPDFSTALLMTKFYDLWRIQSQSPAMALRSAQCWLRDTPVLQMLKYFGPSLLGSGPIPVTTANNFYSKLKDCENPDHRIFSHPYYWAAFTYTGT